MWRSRSFTRFCTTFVLLWTSEGTQIVGKPSYVVSPSVYFREFGKLQRAWVAFFFSVYLILSCPSTKPPASSFLHLDETLLHHHCRFLGCVLTNSSSSLPVCTMSLHPSNMQYVHEKNDVKRLFNASKRRKECHQLVTHSHAKHTYTRPSPLRCSRLFLMSHPLFIPTHLYLLSFFSREFIGYYYPTILW